jgi:hypothetical protein
MQKQNLERLLESIRHASAESIQTLTCPNCKGGLNIQFTHNKWLVLAVGCETCRWRVVADGIPKEPSWVGKLGSKVHTGTGNAKLGKSPRERLALPRSRVKAK